MRKLLPSLKAKKIIFILLAVSILFSVVVFRREAGRFIWENFKLPRLAFFLNPSAEQAFVIGGYYFHTKAYNFSRAKEYYEKAYAINPHLGRLNYQLGRIAFLEGKFSVAKEYLDQEIKLYPEFPRSFYMRGLVYGYWGKYEEAAMNFKIFLEKNPLSWAAHNDLAWIYFKIANYVEAEKYARRGLAIKPDNVWLLNGLGAALLHLGRTAEAKIVLEKAAKEAEKLTEKNWIAAYPANDPLFASAGIAQIKSIIHRNLSLLEDIVDK